MMREHLRRKIFVYSCGVTAVIYGAVMFMTNSDWTRHGYYSEHPWACGLLITAIGLAIVILGWHKLGAPWCDRDRNPSSDG